MTNNARYAIISLGLIITAILGLAIGFYWPSGSTKAGAVHTQSIMRGKDLATFACSGCHNLKASGKSTNKLAPPFRTLVARLSQEGLQEQLEVALSMGHAPMPPWNINPRQSEDLLVFIISIQKPEKS